MKQLIHHQRKFEEKEKKKGGNSGFQNATSALKRMRMDASGSGVASGSGEAVNEVNIFILFWCIL